MGHRWMILGMLALPVGACRPSDILSVPGPSGVLTGQQLQNQQGAEGVFNAGKGQLFYAVDGPFEPATYGAVIWSELLTDEFSFSGFTAYPTIANIDARKTVGAAGFVEITDQPWENLLQARSSLLSSLPGLIAYEPASAQSHIGEAYALAGYAEVMVAELFCAGTPLSEVVPGQAVRYGQPLTTDSLFGTAVTHFDSALANAHGSASVVALASIGLARALMDRQQYGAAATAVSGVATSYVYNVEMQPNESLVPFVANFYTDAVRNPTDRVFSVSDREGRNGLDFVSAHDPRLAFDTSMTTADNGTWYLPRKFEINPADMPLATGIEARLVEAEAALAAGKAGAWLQDLNALRNSGCTVSGSDTSCALGTGQVAGQSVGLPDLSDPGTDSARVTLLFRERAFWLFGTGSRLGDLRRLIRQYGRDQSVVFPSGAYTNGGNAHLPASIPNYGTDVSLTLPTPYGLQELGNPVLNPGYRGCIAPTTAG